MKIKITEFKIEEIVEGKGVEVKSGDTVVMHYTGTFDDGEKSLYNEDSTTYTTLTTILNTQGKATAVPDLFYYDAQKINTELNAIASSLLLATFHF